MIVGAHIETGRGATVDNYLQWLHPAASVGLDVLWEEVEKKPGVYTWPDWIDHNAKLLAGHKIIYTVKTTPPFYRVYDAENSPPRPEHYAAFAMFVNAVISRLKPYGVQIWNEPEMDPNSFYYGGFGRNGGRAYGQMLRSVYLKCKGDAVIFGGGLAMMSFSWQFARDMLDVGKYFDILSYHTYVGRKDQYYLPIKRGLKLRDLAYRPVALIETGFTGGATAAHDENQAAYLQYLFDNAGPIRLIHNYSLANNGWQNTDLVMHSVKKPAWDTWYNWIDSH